jgi:uncharacterized RDD family membrane protein YckC
MNQKEEKGSSGPRPRYVWDPKKLAWIETTEAEREEPAAEEAAVEAKGEERQEEAIVEPKRGERLEEATIEPKGEEGSAEVPVEAAPVEVPVEAGGPQYRGAWIRLLGLLIDLVVLIVIYFIVSRVSGINTTVNTASGTTVTSFSTWQQWLFAAIISIYFVGFWAWRGQTPGKMLIGAKIVKTDGRPIGIGRALLRFVVYFLYLLLWGFTGSRLIVLFVIIIIALIILAFNRRKRGIHDLIAGTVVINSRTKKPKPVEAEPADTSEIAQHSVASEPETDKKD